jgi:hypothetical protein
MSLVSSQTQSRFALLPTEIRMMIYNLCIGCHIFHIFLDGSSMCSSKPTDPFRSGGVQLHCHNHFRNSSYLCSCCSKARLAGLTSTCRLIYAETSPLLYLSILTFGSCNIFSAFFEPRLASKGSTFSSLRFLRRVQLHCGPAKYNSTSTNTENHVALAQLARHAPGLRHLTLLFRYCNRITNDEWPLTNAMIKYIGHFRDLSLFNVRVEPGIQPTLFLEVAHLRKQQMVDKKMFCMEEAFREIVYLGKDNDYDGLDRRTKRMVRFQSTFVKNLKSRATELLKNIYQMEP